MNESKSPWSTYGRLPPETHAPSDVPSDDVTLGAIRNVARGREQLQKYLSALMREYYEIRSGDTGYRKIVDDALDPWTKPETIEERLIRLARQAARRAPRPPPA